MIELKNITKTFGEKRLFSDFNLTIPTGDKVLLSAPSGAGKTTLIKMFMGFERPDNGTVSIGNEVMNKHSLRHIREQIAYVSQDTDLNSGSLVEQLDQIFSYKVNLSITDYKEKFLHYAPIFSLSTSILYEDISRISGGERQRVALIIALLLDRDYLILDEITSGLDSTLKQEIGDFVMNLKKTVIIVSHDDIWHQFDGLKEVAL